MIQPKNRTPSFASSSNAFSNLSCDQGMNLLNQLFWQERFVKDCVRLCVMLMDSIHINVSAVENRAETRMRLSATNHQIHAIEWLHDEVGDQQIGFGLRGFERFERVQRRREQARVQPFHREKRADNFTDH